MLQEGEGGVMYVIEDKKGRFWAREAFGRWTRNLDRALLFTTKTMIVNEAKGERVFEVKLVLGKQVR